MFQGWQEVAPLAVKRSVSKCKQDSSPRWLQRQNSGCHECCHCHNANMCSMKADSERDHAEIEVALLLEVQESLAIIFSFFKIFS